MKTIPLFIGLFVALAAIPVGAQTSADSTTTTTTTTTNAPSVSTARQAYAVAKDGVDVSMQNQVVSIYGTGTPAAIQTWFVIFYDPSVPSHGHAIRIENGQITKSYQAQGGVIYSPSLAYNPSYITDEGPALTAAQNYAAQHAIAYDHVRALLRSTVSVKPAARWRIELMDGSVAKGFVFVNSTDGSFAMFAPPGAVHTGTGTGTGGVVGDAEKTGNDIKKTFLGIGGDLQEFFTGDRTVDQ